MDTLKKWWASFENLPTWKKISVVGALVGVFILIVYEMSKNSGSGIRGNAAADTSGLTDENQLGGALVSGSGAGAVNDNSMSNLLTQYQNALTASERSNQNAISQLEAAYQSAARAQPQQQSYNPITAAATSALSRGVYNTVTNWFSPNQAIGNGLANTATIGTAGATGALAGDIAPNMTLNGWNLQALGVNPTTALSALDTAGMASFSPSDFNYYGTVDNSSWF